MVNIQGAEQELKNLVRGDYVIIKSDATSYEWHLTPKGCYCGGVQWDSGYESIESAIAGALEYSRMIDSQGYHWHGGNKKHKNRTAPRR